jgi:hypothetical protein
MGSGVFLKGSGGGLVQMTTQPYDTEAVLQELLASYPDLLAGDQMNADAPRKWLLVSREVGVPGEEDGADRWSLDHLFLDQDAVPTLVETKRSTNRELRRQVVGQMLDYAANAVAFWPVEEIRARFEARCQQEQKDPAEEFQALLGREGDADQFWEQVKTNLQAGKVRMVFVADKIPPELRRIVEFLNRQMDPAEVLAVEIKQYGGPSEVHMYVSRVIGQRTKPPPPPPVWDEDRFFQVLRDKSGPEEEAVARDLLEWAKRNRLRISWGSGVKEGAFRTMLDHKGEQHHIVYVRTDGRVKIPFQWMNAKPFSDQAKRLELRDRLNGIPGVSIDAAAINDSRPPIPLRILFEKTIRQQFLAVLDWYVGEVRAT